MLVKSKFVCMILISVSIFLMSCGENVSQSTEQDTGSIQEVSESIILDIEPGEKEAMFLFRGPNRLEP